VNVDDVHAMIAGKSVVIVGGAVSIFDYPYGPEIDRAGVVIRLNLGIPDPGVKKMVNSLGVRTDILAGACFDGDLWRAAGRPLVMHFGSEEKRLDPWHDGASYHAYVPDIGLKYQTSGLKVIVHVLEVFEPSSVWLYGFDFFRTQTWEWRRKDRPLPGPTLGVGFGDREFFHRTDWEVKDQRCGVHDGAAEQALLENDYHMTLFDDGISTIPGIRP
jgi:hypothetical protein